VSSLLNLKPLNFVRPVTNLQAIKSTHITVKQLKIKGALTCVNPKCLRRIKLNQTTANRDNQGGSNIGTNGPSFSLFDEPFEPFQRSYAIEPCKYVYIIKLINEKSY
jgi:hypothetical protein